MFFYQKVWRNNVWIFTKLCDNYLRFYVTYNNGNTKNRKFVGDADNENLQQENGMLLMIKIIQTMVMKMKMVQPLHLKLKSLNETFAIIKTHILL